MRAETIRPTRARHAGRVLTLLDGSDERAFTRIVLPNEDDARFIAAAFADAFRRSKRDQTQRERQ